MENKYYFIIYEVAILNWSPKTETSGGICLPKNIQKSQGIIDIHPLQYQIECNKKYSSQYEKYI